MSVYMDKYMYIYYMHIFLKNFKDNFINISYIEYILYIAIET